MKQYKIKRREYPDSCPKCGSKDIAYLGYEYGNRFLEDAAECNNCDFTWAVRFKYQKWIPTGKYSEEVWR